MGKTIIAVIFRIWAFPNSLIGLLLGFTGVVFGGHVNWRQGCLEFHGPFVKGILRRAPIGGLGAMAITFGHTILGQTQAALDLTREHEQVHVRQYERWGPFFIPAYLMASLIAWLNGKDIYRGNVFEEEAYAKSDPSR